MTTCGGISQSPISTLETNPTGPSVNPFISLSYTEKEFKLWGNAFYASTLRGQSLLNQKYFRVKVDLKSLGLSGNHQVESTSGIWTAYLTADGINYPFSGAVTLTSEADGCHQLWFDNTFNFNFTTQSTLVGLSLFSFNLNGLLSKIESRSINALSSLQDIGAQFPGFVRVWNGANENNAVGPSSIIAAVSSSMSLVDKNSLEVIESITAGNFWYLSTSIGVNQKGCLSPQPPVEVGVFDPVLDPWVVYNRHIDRFVILSLRRLLNGTEFQDFICLAVSKTDSPTGFDQSQWWFYMIERTQKQEVETPVKGLNRALLGYDSKFLVISEEYQLEEGFTQNIFTILASNVKDGTPSNPVFRTISDPEIAKSNFLFPSEVYDEESIGVPCLNIEGDDILKIVNVSGVSAAVSRLRVPKFFGVSTVDQPNTVEIGQPLLTPGAGITSAGVRKNRLFTSHSVWDPSLGGPVRSLGRWYEISLCRNELLQYGNIDASVDCDEKPISVWNLKVNADRKRNLCFGFSIGGLNLLVSAAFTSRLRSDPLGTTRKIEYVKTGEYDYNLRFVSDLRWGQYTGLSLDLDDKTFWYTGQYPAKGSNPSFPDSSDWNTVLARIDLKKSLPPPAIKKDLKPMTCEYTCADKRCTREIPVCIEIN